MIQSLPMMLWQERGFKRVVVDISACFVRACGAAHEATRNGDGYPTIHPDGRMNQALL